MRRIVVVGGGISGLSAAWAARRAAAHVDGGVEVLVLERDAQVGGKARSFAHDGWLMEAGPSGFLGGRPELDRLIADVGMDAERVPADHAAARRFIFVRGRMREVGRGPVGMTRSGLLRLSGALRSLREPFVPRRRESGDESVWDFAARRLGHQIADDVICPMTLGIYAGDARGLSLEATFPRLAALEREHGGLLRGLIARRGQARAGALMSFRRGMQSLPLAIAERGGLTVRRGASVRAISRDGAQWLVHVADAGEPLSADAVIIAAEPHAAAPLVRLLAADAADALSAIPMPAVAVVALGYRACDAARVPRGFGVLIARENGLRALGNLWETYVYPERSPEGTVLIRALFGGQVDSGASALGASALVRLAREEAARLYGITAAPVMTHTHSWPRAIPQYALGHLDRVARVERGVEAHPGLFITGFGLRAIGFSDAAVNAIGCGERAAAWLSSTLSPSLEVTTSALA